MVKERKGAEQLGGQTSFSLHIVSEPFNVVSAHGLIWASSKARIGPREKIKVCDDFML